MACYKPLKGYFAPFPNSRGKYPFVFDKSGAALLPCGRCLGCQLDYSRTWALRCVHEASLYEKNCVITLTYADEFLPRFDSLVKSDLQKFLKRLRKKFGSGIRFFACGEYGESFGRPHYHIVVFNHDFDDKELWSVHGDVRLFVSASLNKLWSVGGEQIGFATLGEVNFASVAYVARYTLKKVYGVKSEHHYTRLVPETGELVSIVPEFVVMSRGGRSGKGGIGKDWFNRYSSDIYPDDFVVHQGQKYRVPRFYDQQLEKYDAELLASIKADRRDTAYERRANATPERLQVREKVARAKLSLLKPRSLK